MVAAIANGADCRRGNFHQRHLETPSREQSGTEALRSTGQDRFVIEETSSGTRWSW